MAHRYGWGVWVEVGRHAPSDSTRARVTVGLVTTPTSAGGEQTPAWKQKLQMAMEHSETAEGNASGTGSPEMSIWVWGLVAVGLVALRIVIVSRGNAETALALLQNLNVTAIVLATLAPFFGIAVALIACYAVVNYIKNQNAAPEPKWAGSHGRRLTYYAAVTIILVVFAVALAYYSMSPKVLLILVGLVVTMAVLSALRRSRNTWVFVLASIAQAVVVLVVLIGGTWAFAAQDRLWLPKERLDVGAWWNTGVVYVLSSDEAWTKYLDDQTRTVRVVHTDKVKARLPVTGG